MATYEYPNDGKFHTRYSELKRCIPSQIDRVIFERINGVHDSNPYMDFGSKRHEVLAEYLKKNKKFPSEFNLDMDINPEWVEREQWIEVWENVVIHFTPDAFGKTWIMDLKTTSRGKSAYTSDKQLFVYAYLLGIKGLKIEKVYYVCEIWDTERTQIQGYEVLEKDVTQEDLQKAEDWLKSKSEFLYEALKEWYETNSKND